MTTMTQLAPRKPWKASRADLIPVIGALILAVVASFAVVAFTPMKGKIAYALLFFIFGAGFQMALKYRDYGRRAAIDSLAGSVAISGAVLAFTPVLSLLLTAIVKGFKGLSFGFFVHDMSVANYQSPLNQGGVFPAIVGTLYLIILATAMSLPLAILTALYLTEIKGKAAGFIQFLVQAMSGIPSIVAGVFIYSALLLTTSLRGSTIMGALALAILMIPTVTRTAQEVLLLVPQDLREAGQALGATQWKTVATIVVPAARNGLITAVILGIARIAGETAPLLFTIGVSNRVNWNPFVGGQASLPIYIWGGLGDGSQTGIDRAWSAILVLLIIVLTLFVIARVFGTRKVKTK
jgi:phosphate transport system permease protein